LLLQARPAEPKSKVGGETSIFDGVDTTLARLGRADPRTAAVLQAIAYAADSAQRALDLRAPSMIIPYLAHVARQATALRMRVPSCRHPDPDAIERDSTLGRCDAAGLDLDAAVDLIMRRATDALLNAAGVLVTASADRELVARSDAAAVEVQITNRGADSVLLLGLQVSGSKRTETHGAAIPPGHSVRQVWTLPGTKVSKAQPWWIGEQKNGLYPQTTTPLDGFQRSPELVQTVPSVNAIAIPEEIRRLTDVRATLEIAGATVTASGGVISFPHEDAVTGLQRRALSGVPSVTLSFDSRLEWIRAHERLNRTLRLTAQSFSDSIKRFDLRIVMPKGLRVIDPPRAAALSPHETQLLDLRLAGALDTGRYEFGAVGVVPGTDLFLEGVRTSVYPHLPPVNFFFGSGLWLQAVDISVPARLAVGYMRRGEADNGVVAALQQIGVRVLAYDLGDLTSVEPSRFSTIVLDANAQPTLLGAEVPRLREFVRSGGTLVVLGPGAAIPGVVPYPVSANADSALDYTTDASVRVVNGRSRLLLWPNHIGAHDWANWIQDRAVGTPATADQRYEHVIALTQAGEETSANAVLVAHIGKGTVVYTTLDLPRQIAAGIPGALRLLVNMLSAAVPPREPSSSRDALAERARAAHVRRSLLPEDVACGTAEPSDSPSCFLAFSSIIAVSTRRRIRGSAWPSA